MTRPTTLTSKGQVTIPKEIREALDLKPHDKITFVVADGYAKLQRLPRLEELVDSLSSLASLELNMTVEEAIELAKEERARELFEEMQDW